MYYSDSDDEIEYKKQLNRREEEADKENEEAVENIDTPFAVPEPASERKNDPRSRPQSARALAQAKALQLQEKRKAARTNSSTGMVVASDAPPRPTTAKSSSASGEKLFEKRSDIKDLIKERSQKVKKGMKLTVIRSLTQKKIYLLEEFNHFTIPTQKKNLY